MSVETLYQLTKNAGAIRELDDVRVRIDVVTDDGDTILAGTEGTVVGIWRDGEAYEVEFAEPMGALSTIAHADLTRIGRSVP